MSKLSTIKVTYAGETKRIQAPATYEELLTATEALFPTNRDTALPGMSVFKFYFLDDE